MNRALARLIFATLSCVFSLSVFAAEATIANKTNKTISIIGNSELPKYEVVLPWRVLNDRDPTKLTLVHEKMPDSLRQRTLEEHRDRVFFDRHIKVPVDNFTNP